MADLHHVTNEAGDHFIGIEVEGTFVPVASVSAARVAQLQERAATLTERLEQDDQAAQDAVDLLPISTKTTRSKASTKGGES